MPIVVEAEKAREGRQILAVEGYTQTAREQDNYFVTMYTGAPPDSVQDSLKKPDDDKTLPQSYFVEQPASSTLPPHYHDTDQFQVFVSGALRFGKKPIGALSVHFAGGHTPYGPIYTDDQGTHFFTLRAHWDGGGKPMPQCRNTLQPVRRVYRLASNIAFDTEQSEQHEVMPAEENGLGVTMFRLAPDTNRTLDLPVTGGGQYALVLQGNAQHGDVSLAANSCLYRYPEEKALVLTGGAQGACVLLLQFPKLEALETVADRNLR